MVDGYDGESAASEGDDDLKFEIEGTLSRRHYNDSREEVTQTIEHRFENGPKEMSLSHIHPHDRKLRNSAQGGRRTGAQWEPWGKGKREDFGGDQHGSEYIQLLGPGGYVHTARTRSVFSPDLSKTKPTCAFFLALIGSNSGILDREMSASYKWLCRRFVPGTRPGLQRS